MGPNILVAQNLSKVVPSAEGDLTILHALSLELAKGDSLAIVGASGSGKSTFLRCLNGLEHFDEGHVAIDGLQLADPKTDINAYRREVGMVFQHFNLFPHLTVAQNIAFGIAKHPRQAAVIEEMLELVKLGGLGGRYPHELSGGQQQRVALARALAPEP
ncbi:ATP-binding cassette domain-containing protein, partial [Klebsiella pneumoniae]|uniref:ATP-binding cassette domain-containing protein n=1 Tax=Klebsiella pneumoniae TaxID=573 RepID=UPI0032DB1745